jgi:lipoate-protein ligase B
MSVLRVIDLGRSAYEPAVKLQKRLLEEVKASEPAEDRAHLVLVEHDPPVITLGRRADRANVLADVGRLDREGVRVVTTRRGGDVTYHGPGQLVGYPILRLDRRGRSVHGYIRNLEEALIRTLAELGISAERQKGMTGVWTEAGKVAAIGIAVSRWVSWHGFALNVRPNLEHFGLIVPCGLAGKSVTSVSELLGREATIAEVRPILLAHLVEVLGFDGVEESDPAESVE